MFSEGLAAVEKDGRLVFIDHSGRVVIDKGVGVDSDRQGYAFHDGYCILGEPEGGKVGMIDKSGNCLPVPGNTMNTAGNTTHTTLSMMRQNVSAIMSIRTAPHITTDSWTGRAAGLHRRFTRR